MNRGQEDLHLSPVAHPLSIPTLKVTFYISTVKSPSHPPTSRPGSGQYSSGHLQGITHSQTMSLLSRSVDHSLFLRTLHCRGGLDTIEPNCGIPLGLAMFLSPPPTAVSVTVSGSLS